MEVHHQTFVNGITIGPGTLPGVEASLFFLSPEPSNTAAWLHKPVSATYLSLGPLFNLLPPFGESVDISSGLVFSLPSALFPFCFRNLSCFWPFFWHKSSPPRNHHSGQLSVSGAGSKGIQIPFSTLTLHGTSRSQHHWNQGLSLKVTSRGKFITLTLAAISWI